MKDNFGMTPSASLQCGAQRHLLFCFYSQMKMTPFFSAFFLCLFSPDVCFFFLSFWPIFFITYYYTYSSGGSSFFYSTRLDLKKKSNSIRLVEFSTQSTHLVGVWIEFSSQLDKKKIQLVEF